MSHARAAIAGALTAILGIWIMTNDQSAWDSRELVVALLAMFGVVLLLVGIDIRGRGERREITYDEKEEK